MKAPRGHRFDWFGVPLRLLPGRAAFHERQSTLLVSDLHLGKPASFRAGGIPVPEGVTESDLDRLTGLVVENEARRVIVLGDLAHDRGVLDASTSDRLSAWLARHESVRMQVVPGNHDRRIQDLSVLGFEVLEERYHLDGLDLVHAPSEDECVPTLGGHIHPCVRISSFRGDSMRLPCFWFSGRTGILPAFGSFTGGHVMRHDSSACIFAAGPDEVVPLDSRAKT